VNADGRMDAVETFASSLFSFTGQSDDSYLQVPPSVLIDGVIEIKTA
jgi:hypothetical protein